MPAPAEPSDWVRYLHAITRHKWIVLGVTLVGTLVGLAATRLLDPRYVARTTLWIESAERGRAPGGPDDKLLAASGWVDLVTSSVVLDSVVRDLRLFVTPRVAADSAALATFALDEGAVPGEYRFTVDRDGQGFRLHSEDDGTTQHGKLGEPIGAAFGFSWIVPPGSLAPGRVVGFTVITPNEASEGLTHALKTRADEGGNFLRIQLRGTNAALTAATANAIAERVAAVAADLKRQKLGELEQILGGQLQHAQRALQNSEEALKRFHIRTVGVLPEKDRPAPVREVDAAEEDDPLVLRRALAGLQRDRAYLARAFRDTADGKLVEALGVIGAVQRSPELTHAVQEAVDKRAELRAYRYKYTSASEPVQRTQAELDVLERRQIPVLIQRLQAELGAREAALRARVDSALGTGRRVPPLTLAGTRLERDVASAEELFTTVRQRYEAARLGLVSTLPEVRILDRATRPRRPMRDFAPLLVLLSCAASFGLVVIGTALADRVNPKVYAPEQVTRGMHLTILAAVPHVHRRLAANGGDGAAGVIEALRALRLRLLHSQQSTPLTLTVTSPGPREGKSFICANLALSFAQAGYRVALVDGDIRRGAQHRALDGVGTPGLTDVLSGRSALEPAMQKTSQPRVWLLPAGRRLLRAPELLLSERMRDVIKRLRESYDVVIVDSPPLAAGVDALVLATVTARVLLVLRSGATSLPLAAAKLEELEALPVEALGAVLNDVRPGGAYKYYEYGLREYEIPVTAGAASEWNEPPSIVTGGSGD